jgi:adenine-specific DNA-methyltransferase
VIGAALDMTGVPPPHSTFVDAFAGSGVVSRLAKQRGFRVISNDWEPYAQVLNTAAIACDGPPACTALGGYAAAIDRLNELPGVDGWVTRHLCPADDAAPDAAHERLFYRRATGRRLDAIRARIADWQHAGVVDAAGAACLLAPLLYQACWLANTSGVFKGFHAGWGGSNGTALHRILADLWLSPQRFFANDRGHRVLATDALQLHHVLHHELPGTADVIYVDPPYNQHPYASNYHVLNSLVVWDQLDVPPPTERGWKSAIRADWRERRSAFNDRRAAAGAFATLLDRLDAPWLLLSYSTDGTIPLEQFVTAAAEHGSLRVFCRSYKRYRVSPTRLSPRPRNVEFVLAVERRRRADDAGARALAEIRACADEGAAVGGD